MKKLAVILVALCLYACGGSSSGSSSQNINGTYESTVSNGLYSHRTLFTMDKSFNLISIKMQSMDSTDEYIEYYKALYDRALNSYDVREDGDMVYVDLYGLEMKKVSNSKEFTPDPIFPFYNFKYKVFYEKEGAMTFNIINHNDSYNLSNEIENNFSIEIFQDKRFDKDVDIKSCKLQRGPNYNADFSFSDTFIPEFEDFNGSNEIKYSINYFDYSFINRQLLIYHKGKVIARDYYSSVSNYSFPIELGISCTNRNNKYIYNSRKKSTSAPIHYVPLTYDVLLKVNP